MRLRKRVKEVGRKIRETRMFARAMQSDSHPILVQIVPIRRCNLDCAYCNEYDQVSSAVPLDAMLRRIDRLGELGATIVTLSGGEPTLHPDLDAIIGRIRQRGAIATLITNGLLLTPERIQRLNRAGLDYLQISIDNARPDAVSKKSLQVLDLKLRWLAKHAEFGVTINSVLGAGIRDPQDALQISGRALELGFTSTVGLLHDHSGQLKPLSAEQQTVYDQFRRRKASLFSFAHFDSFQDNVSRGLPTEWHCRAGGRFLYICEDGLVHYCSQQRGRPGIPLEEYTVNDLRREAARPKGCAPFCTISCVHQTAMLDDFRERPREALAGILARRREVDPEFQPPALVGLLSWLFLDDRRRGFFGKLMLTAFGLRSKARGTSARRKGAAA
ncbi:MAG TPA: radical SAM protein [Bryobacteraceae bacterium]|nr:radical SAM protein [Bryobacteraceae bacterium]